jgi:GTP cyclohydrolase II
VDLGHNKIRLITNNPRKVVDWKVWPEITERVPIEVEPLMKSQVPHTKRDKRGISYWAADSLTMNTRKERAKI